MKVKTQPTPGPEYIEHRITHAAATITIIQPVLTDEERANRESQMRTALESVMREYIHRRNRRNDNGLC